MIAAIEPAMVVEASSIPHSDVYVFGAECFSKMKDEMI
jgi:hypothetical protein